MAQFRSRHRLLAALICSSLMGPLYAHTAEALDPVHLMQVADSIPSMAQVEDAVRAQHWAQAETMLNQVVAAKPQSAKAWYFLAQTQEKLSKKSQAQTSLATAERIDPQLKFASPGALNAMHARLNHSSNATAATRPLSSDPLPGYANRPAVGSVSNSAALPYTPPAPTSHTWIYVLLLLVLVGGVGFYFFNKRNQAQQNDERERQRKALLSRTNPLQERASALLKTARFEDQLNSAFGASAQSCLSKANSILGRLKSVNAPVNTYTDTRDIEELEKTLEALESQATRKAWNETPPTPHLEAQPRASQTSSAEPSGPYAQSAPYGAPVQAAPTTVIVQDHGNSGLLQTMILADALRDRPHSSHREYDLERQLDDERAARRSAEDRSYRNSAPVQEPEPPARFDFGNDSSNDSSSTDSSFDTGPSDNSSSSSSDDSSW